MTEPDTEVVNGCEDDPSGSAAHGIPSEKRKPDALAIRARPAPVARFKRGPIVGIIAVVALGVTATGWWAFRPHAFHLGGHHDDAAMVRPTPTDALSKLPASYSDVPKLGPPLPGDLGRPILDRQRTLDRMAGRPTAADDAAQTKRDEQAAKEHSARESSLLVQTTDGQVAGSSPPVDGAVPLPAEPTAKLALDPERDPNAQAHKLDFINTNSDQATTNPYRLIAAPSPYLLSAGSIIAASLITGLRSDLPGLVTAQVTENVYDSPTGRLLLIPQGARLIGSYDSVVAFGQRRVLVVWQRVIYPDGRSLVLDNVPATDPSGYAGLSDKVDFHTWTLLKGVAVSTLLGVGANLTFTGESDLVQAIRESTQQNVSHAGDQLTSRNLQIQPTTTIRPGTPVRLVVHKDLIFAPSRQD